MRIDRELDRVFRITLDEKEAVLICDQSELDFERYRFIANRIGQKLLPFMIASCENPHMVMPSTEVVL